MPVRAGSIVVFSSLTPHATGHNVTGEVRKAYIVQYCHDGATAAEAGTDGGVAAAPCRTIRLARTSSSREAARSTRPRPFP